MWSGIPLALEFLRELRYSLPFSHSSCLCTPSLLALSSLVCALAGFGLGCILTALFTVPGLRRCCLQCFRLGYLAAAELAPQPAQQGLALRARFREYHRAWALGTLEHPSLILLLGSSRLFQGTALGSSSPILELQLNHNFLFHLFWCSAPLEIAWKQE